jgi:hypothetical protein
MKDMHDFVTKISRKQAEVLQNYDKENVGNIEKKTEKSKYEKL